MRRFLWCLPLCWLLGGFDPAPEPQPINLIFLLADDFRHDDLSYFDPERAVTPYLDRLLGEGTYFTRACVTTAICAPSRASILTGQYARRHGIYGFRQPLQGEAWQQTYPMQLRAAGYRTGFVGKYGLNIWVPDKQYPSDDFDFWFVPGPGQKRYLTSETGHDLHYTQMLGRKAVEFIHRYQDEPFCLSLSFLAPHGSLDPNPLFVEKFARQTVPLPPNFGDAYFDQLPAPFHGEESIFGRVNFVEKMADYDSLQAFMRGRMNKIYGLDLVVGRLRHELEVLGLSGQTVIIFSSDHGYYTGEHGLNGKWWMHEESIRVPMVVYDPRLPQAIRHKALPERVLNLDLAPTLLDYAGLSAPASMQGRSFKPLVDGDSLADWRDSFFFEQHFDLSTTQSPHRIPPVEGVVGSRYKYMNYFQHGGAEELYDYLADPYEMHNLAGDSAQAAVLTRMRAAYAYWLEAAR